MTRTSMDPERDTADAAHALEALRTGPLSPLAPTFDDAALYGPLGAYVRLHAPHTEASPAALYLSALVAVGALIGRGPTWYIGGAPHHVRFFGLIIGPTGAGRKGTALGVGARNLLRALDGDFYADRVVSGLSSAEGLIAEVRDPVPPVLDEVTGKTLRPGDVGVTDKRLLVIEGEAAGPFQAMAREGNRLEATMRDAWDGGTMRSMVKRDPQRATDPHVAVLAAITGGELRKLLTETAVTGGLANRFLPVWSTRARLLSRETAPDPLALADVLRDLGQRVGAARTIGHVGWSPEAQQRWDVEYPGLALVDAPSDTVRALLERGAPHVMRLAMLHALLDGVGRVDVPHLEAALAFWRYCADSWRFVYHDTATRSPLASKLLAALESAGAGGLTRTAIRDDVVRSGDVPAERITNALAELQRAGLAVRSDEATGGRPRERWQHARWTGCAAKGEKGANTPALVTAGGFAPLRPFPTSLPAASGHVRVTLTTGAVEVMPADSPDLTDPTMQPLIARVDPLDDAA